MMEPLFRRDTGQSLVVDTAYRRLTPPDMVRWITLFVVNTLGPLPWWQVRFPTVDLAAIVYDVGRLQAGYTPYRDTFNHHFVGYLLPFLAIATVVPLAPPVLKILCVASNFAVAVGTFAILKETARRDIAWLGAGLTVTLGWFWNWEGYAFNLQSALAPLATSMLVLLVRSAARQNARSLVFASLLAGAFLCCDQRAVLFLPLIAVPILTVPRLRRLSVVVNSALALCVAPLICVGYLILSGAWPDFFFQTIIFPAYYRNHGLPSTAPFIMVWVAYLLITEPLTVTLAVAGVVAVIVAERRSWVRGLLLGWLLSAIGYSAAGGRLFPNYFIVLGLPLILFVSVIPFYVDRRSAAAARVLTLVLIALGVASAARPLGLLRRTGSLFVAPTEESVQASAEYIRLHAAPEDRVLVWGFAPQLYVLSGRYNTFKDATLLSLTGGNFASRSSDAQATVPEMVRLFETYLRDTPPTLIAYYSLTQRSVGICAGKGAILDNADFRTVPGLAPLREAIATSYVSSFVASGPCDRVEIFVRHSRVSAASLR